MSSLQRLACYTIFSFLGICFLALVLSDRHVYVDFYQSLHTVVPQAETKQTTEPPPEFIRSDNAQNFHFPLTKLIIQQLHSLLQCPIPPNPHTQHIRLPNQYMNISLTAPNQPNDSKRRFFNPTIIPLPSWSENARYVLVSRVVTSGLHQESLICLAKFCVPQTKNSSFVLPNDTDFCDHEDIALLGPHGGLRCTQPPKQINLPSTPAEQCIGSWAMFPSIPGFHDPRVFWSGKGEPLILINSASQYGCVGLWIVDLRTLSPELDHIVQHNGRNQPGPVLSYPYLTEVLRNPLSSRNPIEKNWLLWFPKSNEAYVQYNVMADLHSYTNSTLSGRTFAKLIGHGQVTSNLTSPMELPCFGPGHMFDVFGNTGHWHQGTNALKLVLCTRSEAGDNACNGRMRVHFAVLHRKFSNSMALPLRYERYFAVWESQAPFRMLGVSHWPIALHNEHIRPWTMRENWNVSANTKDKNNLTEAEHASAYFTYTSGLAWAWRRKEGRTSQQYPGLTGEGDVKHLSSLGTGYLDDEVLVGIGLDDVDQAVVRVRAVELLQCLRLCPGIMTEN